MDARILDTPEKFVRNTEPGLIFGWVGDKNQPRFLNMRGRNHSTELLIRRRLHALSRSLPGAQKGEARFVHEARVATRRLREMPPVVLPGSRGRKLERKTLLAICRRAASPVDTGRAGSRISSAA